MPGINYKRGELMRLFEMAGGLPKAAGDANIEWINTWSPRRAGNTLYLPLNNHGDFFPLLGGRQFLYLITDNGHAEDGYGSYSRPNLFFGGTDESPFLTTLCPRIIDRFVRGRESVEEQLFELLKPDDVIQYELSSGQQALRQGDWFAVPFCAHINDIALRTVCKPMDLTPAKTPESGIALHGTRHRLFSGWLTTQRLNPDRQGEVLIGEGMLKAPDHSDLRIDRPHIFLRTQWLLSPHEEK